MPGIDSSRLVDGPDLTAEAGDPATAHVDTFGHGTHLAGLIAGHDDAATGLDAKALAKDSTDFLGIAPGARVVS